ncbi:MAG: tRNA 2-thiouridine(34) synthase MnmA [Phycisphaerae bacterium]|jgi:tRNA-specific 2-thiouridylase|nr:tRNA 2-thiouridine(34) synthase MnmA [Phycisphaerae bacterium]MDP7290102.1 tRNA 2-thiouridine(34) synthase MnmA [Phycisphaerae bacterium]
MRAALYNARMSEKGKKVIVAMSGGVDSAVAGSRLIDSGYDVTGVFMCLGTAGGVDTASRGCCSPADAADARLVANMLGIELFVLDLSDAFAPLIADFAAEYAAGRTPNPCIHCNTLIKFGRLLERADSLGVDYIATGHYARITEFEGQRAICRAAAGGKDQSYALFGIPRNVLGRILLPVGEIADKQAVRRIAQELDLVVHDKPDSQEICFAPDDDYVAILESMAPAALRPGDIIDSSGAVLGRHKGYGRFTIGQRRGLRVAAGVPMYVTKIDPVAATVTIGPRDEVMSRHLTASGANWHADVSGEFSAMVQIRYNHSGQAASVKLTGDDTFAVEFVEPVSAITPGQAVVVYDGQRMLGGGWID